MYKFTTAKVFSRQDYPHYEKIVQFSNELLNSTCIIAIHSTKLGPAVGGCRVKSYPSQVHQVNDVLALSKAMTYKCSLAGLDYGGGKCVVNKHNTKLTPNIGRHEQNHELMELVGSAVQYFGGDFITGEDVGTTADDMQLVRQHTSYVDSVLAEDPSAITAQGVVQCLQSAFDAVYFSDNSNVNVPVWIQGLGKVGWSVLEKLSNIVDRPNIFVSDLRQDLVDKARDLFGATQMQDHYKPYIRIYVPCALGPMDGVLDINNIQNKIICGSANNQLLAGYELIGADRLHKNGVLYCPDYLVNAGGVITILGDPLLIAQKVDQLSVRLTEIINTSKLENISPLRIANALAEQRLGV